MKIPFISFHRYEKCIGIAFGPFKQYNFEVWYCPRFYEIKEHTHPQQDIWLTVLFCNGVLFHRKKPADLCGKSFWATLGNIGKTFKIAAGDSHHFEVSNWPLIFLNIERWKDGVKPTSAALDFKLTN